MMDWIRDNIIGVSIIAGCLGGAWWVGRQEDNYAAESLEDATRSDWYGETLILVADRDTVIDKMNIDYHVDFEGVIDGADEYIEFSEHFKKGDIISFHTGTNMGWDSYYSDEGYVTGYFDGGFYDSDYPTEYWAIANLEDWTVLDIIKDPSDDAYGEDDDEPQLIHTPGGRVYEFTITGEGRGDDEASAFKDFITSQKIGDYNKWDVERKSAEGGYTYGSTGDTLIHWEDYLGYSSPSMPPLDIHFGSEDEGRPVMDPMEFGEMVNWRPHDGTPSLKRQRAEDEEVYCCICGINFEDIGERYGHNPDPIDKFPNRCCGDCNAMYVIPARLQQMGFSAEFNSPKYSKAGELDMVLAQMYEIEDKENPTDTDMANYDNLETRYYELVGILDLEAENARKYRYRGLVRDPNRKKKHMSRDRAITGVRRRVWKELFGTNPPSKEERAEDFEADDFGDMEYILLVMLTDEQLEEEYGDFMRDEGVGRKELPQRLQDRYRTGEEAEYLREKYLEPEGPECESCGDTEAKGETDKYGYFCNTCREEYPEDFQADLETKKRVRTISGKPHVPRKLVKDKNITPAEAATRLKLEACTDCGTTKRYSAESKSHRCGCN